MHGKKILYLGTNPEAYAEKGLVTHCPLIKTIPRPYTDSAVQTALSQFDAFTHVIFTSKQAVHYLSAYLKQASQSLKGKFLIAIGKSTAKALREEGYAVHLMPQEETQEGVIEALKTIDLSTSYLLLPRSSLSRPLLLSYLHGQQIPHLALALYDTAPQIPNPLPDLKAFDEIVFTSPSTVHAFLQIFGPLPKNKTITPIGPITAAALNSVL